MPLILFPFLFQERVELTNQNKTKTCFCVLVVFVFFKGKKLETSSKDIKQEALLESPFKVDSLLQYDQKTALSHGNVLYYRLATLHPDWHLTHASCNLYSKSFL